MAELVERYVHQVGRYLPPKERAEIEAELRSQIQDQLDDRYGASPSAEEVASVLAEFGHPYQLAISYSRDHYLVGPDLYPYLMMVLRPIWVVIPTIVIFMNLFGALIDGRQGMWLEFIAETLLAVLQATFSFSGVVVLLFAFIQRVRTELDSKEEKFDPLALPKVDDPATVDRFEAVFSIAMSAFFTLIFLYWLYVGGLTLRFHLSDPGEVVPVPVLWLVLLIVTTIAQVILHLLVLRRNRRGIGLWIVEIFLEVFGVICLYFAVLAPAFERFVMDRPSLVDSLGSAPEIMAVGLALITLVSKGTILVKLWSYRNTNSSIPPFAMKSDA